MNRLDAYERPNFTERSPSWLEIACAWGLFLLMLCVLAPQPVKQIGLYPVVAAQAAIQTDPAGPMTLAGIAVDAGASSSPHTCAT